jgi:electron transfer flavoprotein beta subunit
MGIGMIVCVKQVLDARVPLNLTGEGTRATQSEPQPVYSTNPADLCALEEAITLQHRLGGEVTAVTVGPEWAEEGLRYCLARGAARAIHAVCPEDIALDAWMTAWVLHKMIRPLSYDLILCGDRSLDQGSGQVGAALAEQLGLPQVSHVIAVEPQADTRTIRVERQLERGARELLECTLPALISTAVSARQLAYVSVRRRFSVPRRLIARQHVSAFGELPEPQCDTVALSWPRIRSKREVKPAMAGSAKDRMSFLLSGGRSKKDSGVIEASPKEAVDAIMAALEEKGLLH